MLLILGLRTTESYDLFGRVKPLVPPRWCYPKLRFDPGQLILRPGRYDSLRTEDLTHGFVEQLLKEKDRSDYSMPCKAYFRLGIVNGNRSILQVIDEDCFTETSTCGNLLPIASTIRAVGVDN